MTKWVLVTGSARRIGRAIAMDMATQGWNVVVHYHRSSDDAENLAEEIIGMGRRAALAEIDLAHPDHVARLIPKLNAELGTLSALVNNASLFEPDTKDPDGTTHGAVNTEAPRLLSEAFFEQIPDEETGAIVNLLDGVPPESGFSSYQKSKQALQEQTLELAKKFAPRVRINGVAPGPVLQNQRQSDRHFEAQLATTLLKTGISPYEVARAVTFLITSPAITGDILHVNNGGHL